MRKRICEGIGLIVLILLLLSSGMVTHAAGTEYAIRLRNVPMDAVDVKAFAAVTFELDAGKKRVNFRWADEVDVIGFLTALHAEPHLQEALREIPIEDTPETAEEFCDINFSTTDTIITAQILGKYIDRVNAVRRAGREQVKTNLEYYTVYVPENAFYLLEISDLRSAEPHSGVAYMILVQHKSDDPSKNHGIITPKMEFPHETKKIAGTGADGKEYLTDTVAGAVGDRIPFAIDMELSPYLRDGYTTYILEQHDIMDPGLRFLSDSLRITDGDGAVIPAADYVLSEEETEDGKNHIVISFRNFLDSGVARYHAIHIRYQAEITEQAVFGGEGNFNRAFVRYSNQPYTYRDDLTGDSLEDRVAVYVSAIGIEKRDSRTAHPLAGAHFSLRGNALHKVRVTRRYFEEAADGTYYALKDGTYTEKAPTAESMGSYLGPETYRIAEEAAWADAGGETEIRGNTGDDGTLWFSGLAPGEYTLTETQAPETYRLLDGPVYIHLSVTFPEDIDQNGAKAVFTYAVSGAVTSSGTAKDGLVRFAVDNAQGLILPETGGIGTGCFRLSGILLLSSGVLILLIRAFRRKGGAG